MTTLAQAREALAALRPRIDDFLAARADLAELKADLAERGVSPLGALADAKALEARLYADLEHFGANDVQVKGFAPLLLDFPGDLNGIAVLWCWLEGDADIEFYHRVDTGFAGRRRA
jgi:hypothetical protein